MTFLTSGYVLVFDGAGLAPILGNVDPVLKGLTTKGAYTALSTTDDKAAKHSIVLGL